MPMPTSASAELAIVDEMVRQLPAYLDSNAVFRPIVVPGQPTSTLTLGTLRDHLATLAALRPTLTGSESARLDELTARIAAARGQYKTAYGAKLMREMRSQLDSWRYALDDLLRGDAARGDYARDVMRRARIEDCLAEAEQVGADASEYRRLVSTQDARLKTRFKAGPFVGPKGSEQRYPPDRYWYLYGDVG